MSDVMNKERSDAQTLRRKATGSFTVLRLSLQLAQNIWIMNCKS
ncbi:hypothetical protein VcPa09_02656 [Vibrio cholerae]|nr:hypothetical protein VcPa09_02656 [Vibrio cholerae]